MILDAKLVFSDAQAITSTADSTNVLDFGNADPNQGEGTKLVLHVDVDTAFTASGSATLTVNLLSSADDSTYVSTKLLTGAIPKATLVAGYKIFETSIPYEFLRYMKLVYTVATGPMTAGKVNAYIALA